MELRLSGTQDECTGLAAVLPGLPGHAAGVERVSRFCPGHDDTGPYGRVYIRLAARADAPGRGRAARPRRTA
jgi:hypothetical protein